MSDKSPALFAVVGDCHGHLQLALAVLARWQQEIGRCFEAVFLCGDVGTFTADAQLDSTTRRHGKANPCELEFFTQWSVRPQPPWLDHLFLPLDQAGLGLTCPVVMVHGNHEGFDHLARLVPPSAPALPVPLAALPPVDGAGRVRLLPSGWRAVSPSGLTIAGVGGIERGQRYAEYHPMAYVSDEAVARLLGGPAVDLLLTHQGPSEVQGEHGSPTLQLLLDDGVARAWCHGHSTPSPDPVRAGKSGTLVVPLGDIAFPGRGHDADEPGPDGWALLRAETKGVIVEKETPPFLRDFRRHKWAKTAGGLLICPPLARLAWRQGWF